MKKSWSLKEAYKFFHEGELTLDEMSMNGIHVDVPYLRKQYDTLLPQRIAYYEDRLKEYPEVAKWMKRAGKDWSPDSDPQLQKVLYDQMGYDPPDGKRKVDRDTILELGVPFADELINWKKFSQCRNTFVNGLLQEQVDGVIHTDIGLIIPKTYRSSCSMPNLQNQPKRDEFISRIVRKSFIPRPGFQFTDYDFKGMEVCVSCCYHCDENMIRDVSDPNRDMHWDSIVDCFILEWEYSEIDKDTAKALRYCGKNKFTFPQFYGRWWKDCADALWTEIDNYELPNGLTVRRHLARKGITRLGRVFETKRGEQYPEPGTFYEHIKKVEDRFWDERYPTYRDWKKRWYRQYKNTGQFQMLTGFIERSMLSKNDVTNHPIQGTGFHVLLKSAILGQKELAHDRDDIFLVLQVHDSEMYDHTPEASKELDAKMLETVQEQIPSEWDWVNAPLVIEAERSEVDGSWYAVEDVALE